MIYYAISEVQDALDAVSTLRISTVCFPHHNDLYSNNTKTSLPTQHVKYPGYLDLKNHWIFLKRRCKTLIKDHAAHSVALGRSFPTETSAVCYHRPRGTFTHRRGNDCNLGYQKEI